MRNKSTKTEKIALELTPGEAFTMQSELQVAQAVRAAMEPEPGDILHAVNEEATAYGAIRDSRVRAISNRLGRAYATHIKGKSLNGAGRQRSTAKKKTKAKSTRKR